MEALGEKIKRIRVGNSGGREDAAKQNAILENEAV